VNKSDVDGSGSPLEVWRFTDGKAGHEKQTEGFLNALADRLPIEARTFAIQPEGGFRRFRHWLFGQFPDGKDHPDPDLLLGAGHHLHFPMLAARKARGGRALVFMKPSLPLNWFDLCLIPQHDDPPDSARVLSTCGALTTVKPSGDKNPQSGLFLIGGPSSHFNWSDSEVAGQVGKVVAATEEEGVLWKLTTSRRTPKTFLSHLKTISSQRLVVCPVEQTGTGWVEDELARSEQAWVSEDSVSMVYESLTSGCRVGLLGLSPRGAAGRVVRGVGQLIEKKWLTCYADWENGEPLRSAPGGFDEAARCAGLVVSRWFQSMDAKGSSASTRL